MRILTAGAILQILMLLVLNSYTGAANAQGVTQLSSEFEVSGASSHYAAAMGLDPADADGQSRIRIAWHKAPVPGGGFEYQSETITPFEFQKGIFVSTYSSDGVALQAPIRVDDSEIAGWPQDPILAADELGRFVVVWRQAQPSGHKVPYYSIWMRPFDAEGTPLGEARKLTHETVVLPSIDMAATGEFVIILGRTEPETEDNFDKEPPRFWRFGSDFQPVDEEPREVDMTLDQPPISPLSAVALNKSGEFAVAYVNSSLSYYHQRQLRLRTFSPDGSPISQPVLIESRYVWGLQVKWLDADHFVAAWLEGRWDTPYPKSGNWRVFAMDGQAVGPQLSLDIARNQGGIIKVSDSDFAVIWATESGGVELIPSTAQAQEEAIPLAISKTVSWDSYTDYSGYDVSPLSVVPLEDGRFGAVFMNTIDGREMVRAQLLEINPTGEAASFESEIIGPCVADRTATAQLTWSSGAEHAEIRVAGPPAEKLFARVKGGGEISTGRWVRHGLVFQLLDQDSGEILATTKARPDSDSCLPSPLLIEPATIEVCDPREFSAAEILWDLIGISTTGAEIRVNGMDGKLFARGGRVGSASTGEWLTNGMILYLLKPYTSDLLGTATVKYQQTACP